MEDFKTFRVRVSHDNGEKTIKVVARQQSVKRLVCEVEGCPESAIVEVEETGEPATFN